MKKLILNLPFLLAVTLVLTFSSCKKTSPDSTADDTQSVQDAATVSSALSASVDDVASSTGTVSTMSRSITPCGYTVDTSQAAEGIIVINYNGDVCNGISRTGSITITLENYPTVHWRDSGAILTLFFANVKVTNAATAGYIILNGTHTLTNITGGLAWKILAQDTTGTVAILHTSNDMTITFADGSVRSWSVNRLRSYSNVNGVLTVTLSSNASEGSYENVDLWGTNRNNQAFYNAISQPLTVTSADAACPGRWYNRPAAGDVSHYINKRSVTVLYGVNEQGVQVSAPTCPWGYEITYTNAKGKTATMLVSYWF